MEITVNKDELQQTLRTILRYVNIKSPIREENTVRLESTGSQQHDSSRRYYPATTGLNVAESRAELAIIATLKNNFYYCSKIDCILFTEGFIEIKAENLIKLEQLLISLNIAEVRLKKNNFQLEVIAEDLGTITEPLENLTRKEFDSNSFTTLAKLNDSIGKLFFKYSFSDSYFNFLEEEVQIKSNLDDTTICFTHINLCSKMKLKDLFITHKNISLLKNLFGLNELKIRKNDNFTELWFKSKKENLVLHCQNKKFDTQILDYLDTNKNCLKNTLVVQSQDLKNAIFWASYQLEISDYLTIEFTEAELKLKSKKQPKHNIEIVIDEQNNFYQQFIEPSSIAITINVLLNTLKTFTDLVYIDVYSLPVSNKNVQVLVLNNYRQEIIEENTVDVANKIICYERVNY